jgi:nucleoside-diphosphate-sugar epimerase
VTHKVLVTGGGGFIGSNLVDALLSDGSYDVRVLDNFSTGRRENLAHCLSAVELIEGDIRDMEIVEDAVELLEELR